MTINIKIDPDQVKRINASLDRAREGFSNLSRVMAAAMPKKTIVEFLRRRLCSMVHEHGRFRFFMPDYWHLLLLLRRAEKRMAAEDLKSHVVATQPKE